MRVFVLGLDGATWDLLDPLMAQGHLPHLAALVQQGQRAPLQSTYPPVTALAWPAFYTGVNPGKHGVFSFVHRDAEGRQHITGASHVKAPALWHWLADTETSTGVLGMPISYPAWQGNGFMISGFLTPPQGRHAFAPAWLEGALQQVVGKWRFHVPPPSHQADLAATRRFVQALQAETDQKQAAIAWLDEQFQPQLFIAVLMHLDTIQHVFWGALHPDHPHYASPQAQAQRRLLIPVLRHLDDLIGDIAARVLPTGTLIVMSDHGFGPMYRRLALNNALAQLGFLRTRRWRQWRHRVERRWRRWRGSGRQPGQEVQANPALPTLIDWPHTLAFAGAAHELCIFINRRDRFRHGIVEPADVPAVAARLRQALLSLRDESGQPYLADVMPAAALFTGPQLAHAPDLFVRPADTRDVVTDGLLRGGRLYRWETEHAGGWHRPQGIVLMAGAAVKPAPQAPQAPHLLDLAPTILHTLGYQAPPSMDGRVLSAWLQAPDAVLQPLAEQPSAWQASIALSQEEQIALTNRLRGLDYLS